MQTDGETLTATTEQPSTLPATPPMNTSQSPVPLADNRAGSAAMGSTLMDEVDADINDSYQVDQDAFDLELNSMQEHVKNNFSETQERTTRILDIFRRHLSEWKEDSERHVRSLINHQRSVEIRLAEAGEYLRIRAEEVAALSEEVKSLKEALAAEKAARVAADTDIVQLRADLVTERVSLESTLAANVAMKERFDTTTRELGDAREDLRVAGVQAQKSLETITTLESQAARLRGEARNREAKCVALADQVARLERQIAQERGVVTNDEFAAAQRHHLELEAVRHQLQQEKEAELAHAQRQVKFMQAQMQQQKRAFELANSSTATKAEKDELALRAQLLEREERQLEVQRALDLERVHAAQLEAQTVALRDRVQSQHETMLGLAAAVPAPSAVKKSEEASSSTLKKAKNHSRSDAELLLSARTVGSLLTATMALRGAPEHGGKPSDANDAGSSPKRVHFPNGASAASKTTSTAAGKKPLIDRKSSSSPSKAGVARKKSMSPSHKSATPEPPEPLQLEPEPVAPAPAPVNVDDGRTSQASDLGRSAVSPDRVQLRSQLDHERHALKLAQRQVDLLMNEVLKLKGQI